MTAEFETHRRRLLQLLGHGEQTVTQLAGNFTVSRSAISQHLGVLAVLGLVTSRRQGKFQYYRLDPRGMAALRAELDAFKLWLAFIDHGDTKADNQKFACLDSKKNADGTRICKPGQAIYYVSDMGSTFGYSSASEKKAKLANWQDKDPIKVNGGRCSPARNSARLQP